MIFITEICKICKKEKKELLGEGVCFECDIEEQKNTLRKHLNLSDSFLCPHCYGELRIEKKKSGMGKSLKGRLERQKYVVIDEVEDD